MGGWVREEKEDGSVRAKEERGRVGGWVREEEEDGRREMSMSL